MHTWRRWLIGLLAASLLVLQISAASYQRGSSGDTVKEIQRRLSDWGYYSGRVDGIYGSKTEAAVLTSCGGVLGVVSGIVMARLISAVMGTPTAVSPGATAIALGFSTAIGVLFGLLPAVKAANLNPIEALRRD